MDLLENLLLQSTAQHASLCPRQILGVRIGLAGGKALELELPCQDKNLFVIAETDGCFLSGLQAATGCTAHHRTLRIVDMGKVAATFVDIKSGQAMRIAPQPNVRQRARDYAPGEKDTYTAQLRGYQIMPDNELLKMEPLRLKVSVQDLISQPGLRVMCEHCGEEIINAREVRRNGKVFCRACAGFAYYTDAEKPVGISTK
jgi:formylmethanofuran dehydrogenase subunit E